ncbi:POL5 protein, partial [Caloenas nicobarica]|nr:POL5 protein [Caloenas nicobarica]
LLQDIKMNKGVKLLQYVDDLLIAGETQETTREMTIQLLNFLGKRGLKVSPSKLQFVEPEVKYLGHWLSRGNKKLDPDRVLGILTLKPPETKREIRQLL